MFCDLPSHGSLLSLDDDQVLLGAGEAVWEDKPHGLVSFYFPSYFLDDAKPWKNYKSYQTVSKKKIRSEGNKSSVNWQNPDREEFQSEFSKLETIFKDQALQKAVLYTMVKGKGHISVSQVLSSMIRFSEKHPVFLYGWWNETEGMLGATPEILMHIEDDNLSTMACAGTCRKEQKLEKFLVDEKEQREHRLVIDSTHESLCPFGQVTTGKQGIVSLGSLSHLITPISVDLQKGWDLQLLVQALHPTPALGAYPKNTGQKWLKEYDRKMPRGRFGAPAGVVFDGGKQAKIYVAIRNIQWKEDQVQIGVGCGILPESRLENEWRELETKLALVKEMLKL